MEVTKDNFQKAKEEIEDLLENATFISFDSEFSGLGWFKGTKHSDLDTPEDRYKKDAAKVREYGLIQIGLSIFRISETADKIFNSTYCFYLVGKEDGSYRYDSSSMGFLAENGFDFNKLFLGGLTFVSLTEDQEVREKRREKQEAEHVNTPDVKVKDDKSKSFVKDAVLKIRESKRKGESITFQGKSLNSFYRKLLFNNIAKLFPSSHFENLPGHARDIKITHFESEEAKKLYKDEVWEQHRTQKLGFTHIVKSILERGVPLVAHNAMLDVLHFVHKFVSPLPQGFEDFQTVLKANFPTVFDTKLLAQDPPFSSGIPNTSLGCLYEELTCNFKPPRIETAQGSLGYSVCEDGQAHNAGYDAFMTGICFLTMLKTMEGRNWGKKDALSSKHLDKYRNKICFMGSYDMPFLDLVGENIVPDRSFIFSVTCPSTYTMADVHRDFSKLKSYRVSWADDTRFFVIPQDSKDASQARNLLKSIRAACSPGVKVTLYGDEGGGGGRGSEANGGGGEATSGGTPRKPLITTLKRRSDTKEEMEVDEKAAATTSDVNRHLKRLKSIGTELLSSMTLESPMSGGDKKTLASSNADREWGVCTTAMWLAVGLLYGMGFAAFVLGFFKQDAFWGVPLSSLLK